jgi:hypothetical protein
MTTCEYLFTYCYLTIGSIWSDPFTVKHLIDIIFSSGKIRILNGRKSENRKQKTEFRSSDNFSLRRKFRSSKYRAANFRFRAPILYSVFCILYSVFCIPLLAQMNSCNS